MTENQRIWAEAYKENLEFKSDNAYMTYEERKAHEEMLLKRVNDAWDKLSMGEIVESTTILTKVMYNGI